MSQIVAVLNDGGLYRKGWHDGYDAGFECAEIASRCSINEAQTHYDKQDAAPVPPSDLATSSKPGASLLTVDQLPTLEDTLNILKNIPGSGYEHISRG
jgi:hypothetical protein